MSERKQHFYSEPYHGQQPYFCTCCDPPVAWDPGKSLMANNVNEHLVAFLYLLMRDELTSGKVENLIKQTETAVKPMYVGVFLEAYARRLASRLVPTGIEPHTTWNFTKVEDKDGRCLYQYRATFSGVPDGDIQRCVLAAGHAGSHVYEGPHV
jgi:hypothetical protein